jgi:hypothetical protein
MRMTEEEFKKLMEDRRAYNTTHKISNVESTARNGNMAKKKSKRPHQTYRIHVHHRTNKLTDPDGRSIKAAIDALVEAGILPDDNAKIIHQITQSQEITKGEEETIIDIVGVMK